eukprot:26563-Amorphochlora_amoeboformis.AAC.1
MACPPGRNLRGTVMIAALLVPALALAGLQRESRSLRGIRISSMRSRGRPNKFPRNYNFAVAMAIRLVGVRFILTVFPVLAVNHRGTLHLHAKTRYSSAPISDFLSSHRGNFSDNGDLSKFLESNMESSDRGIVNTNYLNEDLDLAQKYRAEASFAWGDIPEDDFAKYVAPYKAATETPCKWRQRFHNQFWDKNIEESEKLNFASCTGLSIIL